MNADENLIAETVTIAAVASDDRDWPRFRSVFADRVRFDASRHVGAPPVEMDADEFAAMSGAVLGGFGGTHHAVSNFLIEVDGDEARCRNYVVAAHYLGDDHMVMRGHWEVELRRTAGRWLIERWTVVRTMPLEGPDLYGRVAAAAHA